MQTIVSVLPGIELVALPPQARGIWWPPVPERRLGAQPGHGGFRHSRINQDMGPRRASRVTWQAGSLAAASGRLPDLRLQVR